MESLGIKLILEMIEDVLIAIIRGAITFLNYIFSGRYFWGMTGFSRKVSKKNNFNITLPIRPGNEQQNLSRVSTPLITENALRAAATIMDFLTKAGLEHKIAFSQEGILNSDALHIGGPLTNGYAFELLNNYNFKINSNEIIIGSHIFSIGPLERENHSYLFFIKLPPTGLHRNYIIFGIHSDGTLLAAQVFCNHQKELYKLTKKYKKCGYCIAFKAAYHNNKLYFNEFQEAFHDYTDDLFTLPQN